MFKGRIGAIIEALAYLIVIYWLTDAFFAFNKYSWMLHNDDSICSIPLLSNDDRIFQAIIAAFFLLTPLIIILIRKLYTRQKFELWLYCLTLVSCIFSEWWIFWGRYLFCG